MDASGWVTPTNSDLDEEVQVKDQLPGAKRGKDYYLRQEQREVDQERERAD